MKEIEIKNFDTFVMMPSAYNSKDELIHISAIDSENRNDLYRCMLCHSEVRPRSINKDNKMLPHFYHLDRSKCTGESLIHKINKDMLFVEEKGFIIKTESKEQKFICKEKYIEKSYETPYGTYTPDITIITDTGEMIFVEINYTNKKDANEFSQKWLYLNKTVIEFDVKQVFQFDITKVSPIFIAIFTNGKYLSTYKNQRDNDVYYNQIHDYIQSEIYKDSAKTRLDELSKLDWFWSDLCKYKHGNCTKEDLLEIFSYIDFTDKSIFYDFIKRISCCKEIKNDLKILINKEFLQKVNEFSNKLYTEYNYIGLKAVQVSPMIHEINIVSMVDGLDLKVNSIYRYDNICRLKLNGGVFTYNQYLQFYDRLNKIDSNIFKKYSNQIKERKIKEDEYLKNRNLFLEQYNKDTIKIINEIPEWSFRENIDVIKSFGKVWEYISLFINNKITLECFYNSLEDSVPTYNFNRIYSWFEYNAKVIKSLTLYADFKYDKISKKILKTSNDKNIKLNLLNSYGCCYGNEININFCDYNKSFEMFKYKTDILVDEINKFISDTKIIMQKKYDLLAKKYKKFKVKIKQVLKNNHEYIKELNVNYVINENIPPVVLILNKDNNKEIYYMRDIHGNISQSQIKDIESTDIQNNTFDSFAYKYGYVCPIKKNEYNCILRSNLRYEVSNIINKKINLFFAPRHKLDSSFKYSKLLDYDFIEATEKLKQINLRIFELCNQTEDSTDYSKILDLNVKEYIHDETIDKDISVVLEDILEISNTAIDNEINIMMDAKFTKDCGKWQPWLLKDFVEILNYIGFVNFHNLILK